jgi:bacillithiol synthase
VVTGQQPVIFSGPNLAILKAISVIKIAKELELAGVPAVPVFWVAAEDHDFEELESTWLLDRNSELVQVRVDLSNTESLPAGWLQFGEDVKEAVSHCASHLPQSEFVPVVVQLLADCYSPGMSPVTSFARMMAKLFAETDLVLVNPLHSELKSLAQPTIDLAFKRNAEMRSALIERSRAIAAAGYHEQVKVDENFTGFFAYRDRSRQVLRPSEIQAGLSWSPNVLLRPLFQDTLFPTVTYVAGPAEIAYLAQAAAAYKILEIPMPPIFPRISASILEPRVARAAEKYDISFPDVFRGRDFLRNKAVATTQDGDFFARLREKIEEELESLRPLLASVDPTLLGALDNSRQKVLHQVETLRGKYVNAAARRDETIERHLQAIINSLFPDKKLQERMINVTSFLARYGFGILHQLTERVSLDSREHQVIEI